MAVDPAEEEGHLHGDQRDVASASTANVASRASKVSDSSSVLIRDALHRGIESKSREVWCRVNKGV